MLGSMFFQSRMDTQQAVFARAGVQFIVLLFTGVLFAAWGPGQTVPDLAFRVRGSMRGAAGGCKQWPTTNVVANCRP